MVLASEPCPIFTGAIVMAMPRKHPPKNAADTIERLASQGHSAVGIAGHFGIVRSTFMRWLDESEALDEALARGKEAERIVLHQAVVAAAKAGKPANVNAFFILKSRHAYREGDQQQVNVAVEVKPVMVVKDHGTDDEWSKKAAEQQRQLSSAAVQAPLIMGKALPVPEPAAAPCWAPPKWSPKA